VSPAKYELGFYIPEDGIQFFITYVSTEFGIIKNGIIQIERIESFPPPTT
jgi:hypothetical protein